MKYTIVDDTTNDILRIYKIPNSAVDTAIDKEAFISDALELEVGENETAIEGNFPKSKFTFDGTDFTQIKLKEVLDPLVLPLHELVFMMFHQLFESGYSLPMHVGLMVTPKQCKNAIDMASSRACESFVSKGKFTPFEYMLTRDQVKEWRALSSPSDAIPDLLQAWFDNSEHATVEEAAQNIEQTNVKFDEIVVLTKGIRHSGKMAIDDNVTGDYKAIALSYIAQLDAIRPEND